MNLAIRRIDSNLGDGHEDTLLNDNFPDLEQITPLSIHHSTSKLGSQFFAR